VVVVGVFFALFERDSIAAMSTEDMVRQLVADVVGRCKTESGDDGLAAEAKVKALFSSEFLRRSTAAGKSAPDASAKAEVDNSMRQRLEQERVEVDAELQFTWHRPPLKEVAMQAADVDTVRIFLNGCFDLMHVGHFNVLRQAKATFYQKGYKRVILVAGIHSDVAITRQKGAPLQTDEERIAVLMATKWVDEVVADLPYVSMSARMADRLQVSFICHGDDLPSVKSGGGMYSDAIEKGRFQVLKRTEGVSTTQILERLLRQHPGEMTPSESLSELGSALATTQRLSQFGAPGDPWRPRKLLSEASRVVYVQGTFDLLHVGQVQVLEQAARLGDFLLVGLHSDETVRAKRGSRPVLSMLERAMGALSLRVVDDVVLDVPWEVTRELITTMNVSVMVAGKKPAEIGEETPEESIPKRQKRVKDDVARVLGIFTEVESNSNLTILALRQRFLARRQEISQRNSSLWSKEQAYIEKKVFVPET